jgi:hypothetical protein
LGCFAVYVPARYDEVFRTATDTVLFDHARSGPAQLIEPAVVIFIGFDHFRSSFLRHRTGALRDATDDEGRPADDGSAISFRVIGSTVVRQRADAHLGFSNLPDCLGFKGPPPARFENPSSTKSTASTDGR